ncbi:hypothetical protein D9M69_446060 [compost metagenome]
MATSTSHRPLVVLRILRPTVSVCVSVTVRSFVPVTVSFRWGLMNRSSPVSTVSCRLPVTWMVWLPMTSTCWLPPSTLMNWSPPLTVIFCGPPLFTVRVCGPLMVSSSEVSPVYLSAPSMKVVRSPSTVCVSLFSTSIVRSFCAWILIDSHPGSSSMMKWLANSPSPLIVRLMKPLTVALAGNSSGGIWSAL